MEAAEMEKKRSKGVNGIGQKQEEMSLLDHLEKIVELTGKQGFTDYFFEKAGPHINYAADILKLTGLQTAIFAHFLNQYDDQSITMESLAKTIKCGKLRLIKYMNEFDVLEKRKLIRCRRCVNDEYRNNDVPTYRVPQDVVAAVKDGKAFIPAGNENLSPRKYFKMIHSLFAQRKDGELSFESFLNETKDLANANGHLLFVQKLKQRAFSADEAVILLYFCDRLVNNDDEYIGESDFDSFFDNEAVLLDDDIFSLFRSQKHSLMKLGLVENCNSDGFLDSDHFKLTDKAKEEFLAEINLKEGPLKYGADYISAGGIQTKKLFYNEKTAKQIGELSLLLKEENFASVRERLGENGMRRGFVCLFYGPPGTGKTETVYQICRETGRDIMTVDIAQTKSCWVGESEKLIKQVFDRYRGAVKSSAAAPVLLFNEADAVIGKRLEVSRSVDNMYNAMQNIILQEMENLDGILIATTNLTGNMDKAIERRFLYKVEFEKPALNARLSIWQSVIPELSGEEAEALADTFDFAGGQIENIARKRLAASIISGVKPSLDTLTAYCRDEALGGRDSRNRIGFGT
jgi:hypothetical protein